MMIASLAANAQWHLDLSFGTTSPGITHLPLGPGSCGCQPGMVAVLKLAPDTLITVYNESTSSGWIASIAKTTSTGAMVTSYGTGGTTHVAFHDQTQYNQQTNATDAKLFADGSIIVVGTSMIANFGGTVRAWYAKFDANGVLTSSFEFDPARNFANSGFSAVVTQPNGDALILGAGLSNAFSSYDWRFYLLTSGNILTNTLISAYNGFALGSVHGFRKSNGNPVFTATVNHCPGCGNYTDLQLMETDPSGATFTAAVVPNYDPNRYHGSDIAAADHIRVATSNASGQYFLMDYGANILAPPTIATNAGNTGNIISMSVNPTDNSTFLFSNLSLGCCGQVGITHALPSGLIDTNFPSAGAGGTITWPIAFNNAASPKGVVLDNNHVAFGHDAQNVSMITDLTTFNASATYQSASCPNEILSTTVANLGSTTIQWYNSTGAISGATNATYTAITPGTYYAILTAYGSTYTTNTVTVNNHIFFDDIDGDGYGGALHCAYTQPAGTVLNNTDCNDACFTCHPGAPEICDGLDNDCDGTVDMILTATNGLRFDGVDDNVQIGSWFNEQVFTIEFWAKPGATQNNYAMIIDDNHSGGIRWNSQQQFNNTNTYDFSAGLSGGSAGVTYTLTANQWQHIALVKGSNFMSVYRNGVLISTTACSGTINGSGGDFIRLGQWAGGSRAWNGTMDEVRLWNVARTQAQIQANMNSMLPSGTANLLANYHFNQGVANANNAGITNLLDDSSVPHNGTLVNFALNGSTSNWTNGNNFYQLISQTLYADADGDGYGNPAVTQTVPCGQTVAGYVANNTDCDDTPVTGFAIHPGATEIICNGIDENCNGMTDDLGVPSTPATSITSNAPFNEICVGTNVNLTVNGGSLGTGASWKWFSTNCTGTQVGTGNTINVNPTLTTSYFVKADGVCNTTLCVQLTITVKTAPPTANVVVPSINNLPAYACNGTSVVNINVPAVATATQYIWDGPTGTTFNGGANPYTTTTPSANIVFGAPNGSGYYIGVQAANACGATVRKTQWVRGTLSVPASVNPVVSGQTVYCAGTTASFSCPAVTGATNYLWTITGNATVVGSGTNCSVTFSPSWSGGTLCVSAQTPCYTSATKCIALGIGAATAYSPVGPASVCPGQSSSFSVPASPNISTYNWSLPATITNGAGTSSITATINSGFSTGNVCVTATTACGVVLQQKCIGIYSGAPATPSSITGPVTGMCGQTAIYTCLQQSGVSYAWISPLATINSGQGTNAVSITFPTSSGSSTVSVQAFNSCGYSGSRSITVNKAPTQPGAITAIPSSWCANTSGVEFNVNTSGLTGTYTLNWSYPGSSVAQYVLGGGNSNSLILNWLTGSGNVYVTASNACGNSSKNSTWANSCREKEENETESATGYLHLSVYPNPANTIANVEFASLKSSNASIEITDIAGRLISSSTMNTTAGINTVQLNVSKLAKGVYLLKLNANNKTEMVKVIIESLLSD